MTRNLWSLLLGRCRTRTVSFDPWASRAPCNWASQRSAASKMCHVNSDDSTGVRFVGSNPLPSILDNRSDSTSIPAEPTKPPTTSHDSYAREPIPSSVQMWERKLSTTVRGKTVIAKLTSINPADFLKGSTWKIRANRKCNRPWGTTVSQLVTSRNQFSIFRNSNRFPKQLKIKNRLRLDSKPINSSSKHKGSAALRQEAGVVRKARQMHILQKKDRVVAPDGIEQKARTAKRSRRYIISRNGTPFWLSLALEPLALDPSCCSLPRPLPLSPLHAVLVTSAIRVES